jgi:hypothetical protein
VWSSATISAQPWITRIDNSPDPVMMKAAADYERRVASARALKGRIYREVEGETNSVYGRDWRHFEGRVAQVHSDGMRVEGQLCRLDGRDAERCEFFVVNFPFQVADGDVIASTNFHMGKLVAPHTYATAMGSHRTLRKLDYGRVVQLPAPPEAPPPSAHALAERKAKQAGAVFEFYRVQAEGGDALAQFRLGELYRDGNGVDRDPLKACVWFRRAVAQGHKGAEAALADCEAANGASH